MELFIRANDIYMEIHKVTLKDGHVPMIGDQLPPSFKESEHGYTNPYKIEPAVWFKVKVVDSVSIDCTKRTIMWNSDSSLPYVDDEAEGDNDECHERDSPQPGAATSRQQAASKRRKRVSESMYIGGELYGIESDLDELFDTLQLAVVNFASSDITRDLFNSEIMRMLHCHVLPLIKLTSEDVPRMKKLFEEEEQCIRDIDVLILQKDKQMDEISSAMLRQRNSFLTNLVTVTDNRSTLAGRWKMCDRKVARMLVEDIETDISEVYQRLDEVQKDVEEAKHKLYEEGNANFRDSCSGEFKKNNTLSSEIKRDATVSEEDGADSEKILKQKRTERNECHKRYEKLLYARENLKDYINETEDQPDKPHRRSFLDIFDRSPKHQGEPLHNIYMGMREKLEDVKKEAKALIDKKVLMISVKEAIRTTLEELELHEESTGYDVGVMHGSRPTDVLHRSRKPKEWLSLAEKMAELIGHHSNQACLMHNNFCKVIADRCQAAVLEKQLVDLSYQSFANKNSDTEPDGLSSASDSGVFVTRKLYPTAHEESEKDTECHNGEATNKTDSDQLESPSITQCDDTNSPIDSIVSDSSDLSDSVGDTLSSPEVRRQSDLCLYEDSVIAVPLNGPGGVTLLQVEGQLGDDDIVIVHSDNVRDNLRKTIDEIKGKMQNHFKEISKLIQNSLDINTQIAFKKIWLCYENHLYELLMTPLMDLYRLAFRHVSDRLENMIPGLTVEDLDLDDTTLANMLEESLDEESLDDTECAVHPTTSTANIEDRDMVDLEENNNVDSSIDKEQCPETDSMATSSNVVMRNSPNSKRSFRRRLDTHPLRVQCAGPQSIVPGQVSPRGDLRSGSTCLKRIKIHYPVSVTVIGHRQSWPRRTLPEITENLELGIDVLHSPQTPDDSKDEVFKNIRKSLFSERKMTPELPDILETANTTRVTQRKMKLRPEFQEQFSVAKTCLAETLEGRTPLCQLQSLMRCLREVTNCLSEYQLKYCSNQSGACADDIIDMLIILLLNCDVKVTAALYPHLMMLSDTLPPFFEGGPYQFCLVQFTVAYQFLQDRLLLKKQIFNK